MMSWLHPSFLWLLLALPLAAFLPRGRRDPGQRGLRVLVFAALVVALARPVQVEEDRRAHQVFVVDASPSAVQGAAALESAAAMARALPDDARASLVVFGGEDAVIPPGVAADFDLQRALPAARDGSPLGVALAAGAAEVPAGSRGALTILSDARATDRRWGRAVQELQERGLPVHGLALDSPGDDVYPVRLLALQPLRVGHGGRLAAEVFGVAARCDLRLDGPDGELARLEGVRLDGLTTAVLELEPGEVGFLELSLQVEVTAGANARADNDQLRTTVAVDEPRRVLYLGERVRGGRSSLARLAGAGFQVEAWDGQRLSAETLASYDLAVLDDLPRETLGDDSMASLARAVEGEGLGLLASGGKASFGPGGYHDTPVAELLPVEFIQKEEKRDPSTSLVVIIDTSGSMGGNRVQLAKEVARLAIRRLLPHDKVGLVEFYGAKRWAAPIQPASNSIEIERALNRLDAGGGTVILPAIEEAFYGLKNVQTRYKHVLILTDGGVETGAFEPLLRRMAADGINISTVLIGPEAHSEFLVTLANWGKGRFYSVPNRFNLPEILLKQPASSKLPAYRPGVHQVRARGGASWWGDLDAGDVPELAGYVETRERPGAQVLVETVEGAHPVLASWRYGLGRVTAFTSEPSGPGTEPWADWPEAGAFWARVLERTASDLREPYEYELRREGNALVLSARRDDPRAGAPRAQRLTGAEPVELEFRRRAPDRFEARLQADPAEELRLVAEASAGGLGVRRRLVSPAFADRLDEHRVPPQEALDLAALSASTGGEARPFAQATDFLPAAAGGTRALRLVPLWPWFVLLALGLYLVELAYRRRPQGRATTS